MSLDPLPEGVPATLRKVSTSTIATQLSSGASASSFSASGGDSCAGVAVYPGDVLVGDRDGVLVIPRQLAAEIAEQGYEQERLEAYVSTKIHAGEPLWGNHPPGEQLKAEYKEVMDAADVDRSS